MKRIRQLGFTALELLVALVVIIILFLAVMPMFSRNGRGSMIRTQCISNLKQVDIGLVMYQSDYDERMPLPNEWMQDMYPYVKTRDVYRCPIVLSKDPGGYGYALNDSLCGRSLAKEPNPDKVVSVFESSNTRFNAHDAVTSLPNPGRHDGSNSVGFLDGHAKAYKTGAKIP